MRGYAGEEEKNLCVRGQRVQATRLSERVSAPHWTRISSLGCDGSESSEAQKEQGGAVKKGQAPGGRVGLPHDTITPERRSASKSARG